MTEDTLSSSATVLTGDDLAAQALADAARSSTRPTGATSGASPAATQSQEEVASTLISLQNVIERNVSELDRLKEQLKSLRESLKNIESNDETLSEAQEQATQVMQKVKERKAQLRASQEVNQLKANVAELTERKKEIEEALNTHLLNLFQFTGAKTFDTSSGETREFDIRASVRGGKKKGDE